MMDPKDMASASGTGLLPTVEPVPVSPLRAAIPDVWKGGYDRVSWMGRYSEAMMRFGGMQQYEAECWALNAWEASPDDAEPDDTASDDLAYSAEDAE